MASTMTDVLVLLLLLLGILLLSTGLYRLLTILFTHPATQEGQNFLTAIEDMVLPMGSFPSELFYPWSSTRDSYTSNSLPSNSNSDSEQEAVPAPDEPIHIQDTMNEVPNVSFSSLNTIEIEPMVDATSSVVTNELAEFHVFEKDIRELIDPEGIYPSRSKSTRELVADMINNHAEAMSDMKHDREEDEKNFERTIEEHETKYHDLDLLYEDFSRQNVREQEKSRRLRSKNKCLKDQIEEKIQMKGEAEQRADNAEQLANARIQKRIEEVKSGLEQDKKAAEDKLRQERDSAMLWKRQIESELLEARIEVEVVKEQRKTAVKEDTKILNIYKESLRQERLTSTTSEKRAEFAERKLEDFRNEKFVKHSVEVTDLQKQLRASKELAKSLEPWKTKAENHERIYQRLREKVKNTADDIRETKDHEINGLKLDIRGLQRDMATDEVTINRQNSEIAKLESGKELLKLKSELGQAKKQLEDAELETQKLRRNLATGEERSKQDAETLMKTKSQHEEDRRIAVDNAIQQAQTAAAGKAAEKEQE